MTDPFDEPTTDFTTLDDLLDRLVLVVPQSISEHESKQQAGKTYERITADVIVLDGPVTDKVDEVPGTLTDMFISGKFLVGQLRGALKKPNGMVLGRLTQSKAHRNAWQLTAATEADKELARPAAKKYLEAKDSDPFATAS